MTIGRIPKVDPGATQPQDRKPSPPAGRAGFKTAPSGKDRVPPKPSQPASGAAFKSTAAPPADDPGVQERGRRGACQPASLRILKRHPRLRKATLKDPRRHSGNSRLAHPPGRQDRRQSAKTIIRSNSRKRLRHNPRRKRREAGRNGQWLEPVPRNPNRTNSLPRPLARGQFEYHDYATVWQAKAGPTIHRSGPGPRRFYAKTRAREYRAVRFAQAQDKWYQDGQVTLTSDIVKTVTADHVRLFPATRRQSNSSTSRSHRKRCWRCESCP